MKNMTTRLSGVVVRNNNSFTFVLHDERNGKTEIRFSVNESGEVVFAKNDEQLSLFDALITLVDGGF